MFVFQFHEFVMLTAIRRASSDNGQLDASVSQVLLTIACYNSAVDMTVCVVFDEGLQAAIDIQYLVLKGCCNISS